MDHGTGTRDSMNDAEIRAHFHRQKLRRQHQSRSTLVVDELGLRHGACRADIAVVSGRLTGYEIKSDRDALSRLPAQIVAYNAVFDRVAVVACARHLPGICHLVPEWWGITVCLPKRGGGVRFVTERACGDNQTVEPLSLAKLLWRTEVVGILREMGEAEKTLKAPRNTLYPVLIERLTLDSLRKRVRLYLRCRRDWRCQKPPSQCGG